MTINRTRLFLVLLLVPILLLSLASGIVVFLLNSESGTRLLTGQASRILGDQVTWGKAEGSLSGPLVLQGISVKQPGLLLEIESLTLDWSPTALLGDQLRVNTLAARGIQVTLSASDDTPAAEPFDPAILRLPVAISMPDLRLDSIQVNLPGENPLQVDSVTFSGYLAHGDLALEALALESEQGRFSLIGSAQFDQDAVFDLSYQVRLDSLEQYDAGLPQQLNAAGRLQGVLQGDEISVDQLTMAMDEAPLELALQAEVAGYTSASPVIVADLQWRDARWPLTAEAPDFASDGGSLNFSGTVKDYRLAITAELLGADIPASDWTIQGQGNLQQLTLQALQGQVLDGELRARGTLAWDPLLRWKLQIEGEGLDPGQVVEDLYGEIALSLTTQGLLDSAGDLQASASVEQLTGTLLDYPLTLSAELGIAGETLQVEQLDLASGKNHLEMQGDASARALALKWKLDAPQPDVFLPEVSGYIRASGHLAGTPETPVLHMHLANSNIAFDSLSVPQIQADLIAGMGQEDPLELSLSSGPILDQQKPLLQSLRLDIVGSISDHHLNLAVDTGGEQLSTRLAGGLLPAMTDWRGQLEGLNAHTEDFGNWSLVAPANLMLSSAEVALEQSCLDEAAGARVCADARWQEDGSGAVKATLRSLAISQWLPEVTGVASGEFEAGLAADGSLAMISALQLSAGQIAVQLDQGQRLLQHGGASLDAEISGDGLVADLLFNAPEQGKVKAQLKLPALSTFPLAEQQPLQGELIATLPSLAGLAAWIPEVSSSSGRLDANLQLTGDLGQPGIAGQLLLSEGALEIPLAGLKLQQINLQGVSDEDNPDRIAITGAMQSGRGHIEMNGRASLANSTLGLAMTGERFQVFNTADARVVVSPDLQIDWAANVLKLRGDLLIPEADITPHISLNPASGSDGMEDAAPGQSIAPSRDVVVINGPVELASQPLLPEAPFSIDSQIRLILGDKVGVNAAGFISGISGAVTFTNTPDQPDLMPMARGSFSLEHGTFRSYGQDLDIEAGHIIFADVPATEPELNIRAVRWIDDDPEVTAAGVLVTGSLTQPGLDLFSRPQMEPSVVQTYLLTGRSSGSRDNVLSIGTYVSPRIYVGYGYNMLRRTSEFNSLFSITPRYGVGADLGEADNNAHVTFTYER